MTSPISPSSPQEEESDKHNDSPQPSTKSTNDDHPPLPRNNAEYGKKEYWDDRFANEQAFEWLVSYRNVAAQLKPFLNSKDRILVVGCGNSSFSSDLYDDGCRQICSLDYSQVVVDEMRERNEEQRPEMEWVVMDMTDMNEFPDESFDVIIDKAAMDAIMTQEGDVWNPAQRVVDQSRDMCRHVSRILKSGGHYLHISFAQPHFRKKYLLGWHAAKQEGDEAITQEDDSYSHEFGWSFRVETIAGDENDGCFHHFLYIMTKEETPDKDSAES